MNNSSITKKDLQELKEEIVREITEKLSNNQPLKKWLKSTDVRQMLNISPGTLQTLRDNGTLPYTLFGKTMYYEYNDVIAILERNKKSA